MMGARVIEVDRLLDQAQPEDIAVEGEIARRAAGNGGDMVKAWHRKLHCERATSPPLLDPRWCRFAKWKRLARLCLRRRKV
jgi:hypothetical protein